MPYLIKYSSEIGTKSPGMKWRFIRKLAGNIRAGLQKSLSPEAWEECELEPRNNHIVLHTPQRADELLSRVPGIQYFVHAESFAYKDEDSFLERADRFFRPSVESADSFAIKARTRGETPIGRKRTEIALGDRFVPTTPVDLDNPGTTCFVELDGKQVHLYTRKDKGCGGTPIGIQGSAINLFSGGIDSPVAAWRSYRIGLDQHFLFFDLGSEEQKKQAIELFRSLKKDHGHGSSGKWIELNLLPLIAEIRKAPPRYQNLILKYVFYRAAEGVARLHSTNALITGESLGQVSTQTARNLATLDRCISISLHRPLFSFSKEEIKEQAARIGTFDASYKGKEFCALATKKVTTGASLKELKKAMTDLELEPLIREAVEERLLWDLNSEGELELRRSGSRLRKGAREEEEDGIGPENADRIIDLRTDSEIEAEKDEERGERIPFERAMEEYFHWERNASYYFICNYGSKSRIIAHYMRKEGFRAGYGEGGALKALKKA